MAFIFNPNKKRGVFMIPSGATKSPTPTPPSFTNTYSLAFDGIDDFVSTGYNYNALVTPNLSISFWFKSTSTSLFKFPICIQSADGGYTTSIVMVYGDNLLIADRTGWVFGTNQDLNDGNWHNVIVSASYSGSTATGTLLNMYLDGNLTPDLSSSTMGTGTASYLSGDLYVGSFNGVSNFYDCYVDEVAVFETILTSSDITSIYNSGVPNNLNDLTTPPTAWYRNGDNGTWKSPQWLIPNNINVANSRFSNYSFSYDGVDDYLIAPLDGTSTGGILAASDSDVELTISFWFKLNSSANLKGIFQWANQLNDGTPFILMQQRNSTDRIRFSIDNSYQTMVNVNIGQWYNVILTRTALDNTWRGYLDGVEFFDYDDGGSFSAAIRGSATDIYLANGYNGYSPCNIDEVAVWNSVQNVATIYNSGVPNDLSSLSPVGYWRSEQSYFTDNWLVNNSALSNYSTRSFNFDGVDDRIVIPHSTSLDVVTGNHSLSFWMKANVGTTTVVMEKGRGDELPAFIISNLIYWGGVNAFYGGSTNINDNNWHHIVFVATGTTSEIFIDGSLVATGGNKVEASANTEPFTIGTDANGNNDFTGLLDEISIFNYALSSSEITTLYNSGEPARIEGATSHWRMGEDATFNTNWSLPDNGSASNTGTSANMTISDLQGEAPNYTGGGLSNNMTIEDRVGDASNSTSNAVSFNMDEADRETDVPT